MQQHTVQHKKCPHCHRELSGKCIVPKVAMRVCEVLSCPYYDLKAEWVAGLVEITQWNRLIRPPVAVAYDCPWCSLGIWEASSSLPVWLRRSLTEALGCMQIGAYTALSLMSRRIVEEWVRERGLTHGNLANRLATLAEQQVLKGAPALWTYRARELGNLAAHSGTVELTDEEGISPILLVLALAQALYVEPPEESEDELGIWKSMWKS